MSYKHSCGAILFAIATLCAGTADAQTVNVRAKTNQDQPVSGTFVWLQEGAERSSRETDKSGKATFNNVACSDSDKFRFKVKGDFTPSSQTRSCSSGQITFMVFRVGA
jgi:hypothetical protein